MAKWNNASIGIASEYDKQAIIFAIENLNLGRTHNAKGAPATYEQFSQLALGLSLPEPKKRLLFVLLMKTVEEKSRTISEVTKSNINAVQSISHILDEQVWER